MTSEVKAKTTVWKSSAAGKIRLLAGVSVSAAAMLLATVPQKAQAQQRAPGMMVQNYPTGNAVTLPQRVEMVQNQPHARAPDFAPRDVRITAPVTPLPVNDVRISAPVMLPDANEPQTRGPDFQARDIRISSPISRLPQQDIRISSPITLPDAYQPQTPNAQFNPSDIRISAPVVADLDTVRINAPVPGLNEAQMPPNFAPINQPQAIVSRAGFNVLATATYDDTQATFTPGNAGNPTDAFNISAAQTIVNWVPFDTGTGTAPITFLPAGRQLGFVSDIANFTVLNRILPSTATRPVQFDGFVTGLTTAGPLAFGGNIWFYSPGGIIVGSQATFNMASLVLTANDIDTSGGLFGPGGSIRFNGASGSLSAVTIQPNNDATPQINLTNDNSFLAIVAPRVQVLGDPAFGSARPNVNVNGSVAYIGAEQAELTINNGLFDISIGVGTEDLNGIVHTGTTTGPVASNQPGNFDYHNIVMAAVPKNQAMTMLLSGSVGYAPADSAITNQHEGTIILTAGGGVGTSGGNQVAVKTVDPAQNANIEFGDISMLGDIDVFANNNINMRPSSSITADVGVGFLNMQFTAGDSILLQPLAGADMTFTGNTVLQAANVISMITNPGSTLTFNGNLTATASAGNQGGTINISSTGDGTRGGISGIGVDGVFNANAGVAGRDSRLATVDDGTDTFGGTVNVDLINGGVLQITNQQRFGPFGRSTFNVGAAPIMGLVTAGQGTGGTINFNITGTESNLITAGLFGLTLDASGSGGSNFRGTATGGTGIGGLINFNVNGGTISGGTLSLDAGASASSNATGNLSASQNNAIAGSIVANFTDATVNLTDELSILNAAGAAASYDAAGNRIGGDVAGGAISVNFDNSTVNVDRLILGTNSSRALAGNVVPGTAGNGVTLNVLNGSNITIADQLGINTAGSTAGTGNVTASGDINLLVDNSILAANGSFQLDASRTTGAAAGALNDGIAGTINVTVQGGGTLSGTAFSATTDATSATSGGSATAGDIFFTVDGGTVNLADDVTFPTAPTPSLSLTASGFGRGNDLDAASTNRGVGRGGNIAIALQNSGVFNVGTMSVFTNGAITEGTEGPDPVTGQGGDGIAGSTTFNLINGTFTAGDLTVSSDGFASFGGSSGPIGFPSVPGVVGSGGDGSGGSVTFNLTGADVTVDNLTVSADGVGGDGGSSDIVDGNIAAGNGGLGTGGNATLNALSGSLTVNNSVTVSAGGFGGLGGNGAGVDAGNGGDSIGGTSTFNLEGSASVNAGAASITVSSNTTGGAGGLALVGITGAPTPTPAMQAGNGGNAIAGTATFNNNSGNIGFSNFTVSSVGTGGAAGRGGSFVTNPTNGNVVFVESFVGQNGGNGGSGTGGIATVNLNQDDAAARSYIVDASGIGAAGSFGINGGNGGLGQAGTATLNVNNANVNLASAFISAIATGGAGAGGNGTGGNGGAGGDAIGGNSILNVNGALGAVSSNSRITIIAEAAGGTGGDGGTNPIDSGPTGDGGNGGNGTGGTIRVSATGGATLNYTADGVTNARGIGGNGGNGGNARSFLVPGNGGNGGNANGGSITFSATGGSTLNASGNGSDSQFAANAIGGAGGLGGAGASSTFGDSGDGGDAAGGNVNLTLDGAGSSMIFAESLRIDVGGAAARNLFNRANFRVAMPSAAVLRSISPMGVILRLMVDCQ
ncbi:beta strand repeat-containing protein [Parasphingorhabdus halotolerans]|uniref:Uncharacterized protein n=1 Tax=Parasphingorhabdus halotolerans TaxID=2725558 RepID=A0A6H2DKG1_9SPHN|nr:hypothetical protein [Parasphingorhabdus halotolerans]QJB68146.1 hypothetical protein HF685_01525 [Parasphingorhabdus halotolerans]